MARDSVRTVSFFLPVAETIVDGGWRPAADVYRTRDGWLVKFDLAGVRPQDVQVGLKGRALTVRGCRRDCCLEDGCAQVRMEIAYSHFERRIELPGEADRATLALEQRDGMLLVRVRRRADG